MKYKICLGNIIINKEFSASEVVRLCYKYSLYEIYNKNKTFVIPSKHKIEILDNSCKEILKIYYIKEEDLYKIKAEIFNKIYEKHIST